MILEIKEPCGHSSVYGYDDVAEWLNDIVMAYETNEMLGDFIPLYLSIKLHGKYLSIVNEGKLEPEYQKVLDTVQAMSAETRHIGSLEKIVIDETEQDMLVVFKN